MAEHRHRATLRIRLSGRVVWLALSAAGMVPFAATWLREAGASPPRVHPTTPALSKKTPSPRDAGAASPSATPRSMLAAPPAANALSDAGFIEAKTLEGGTRAYKFSEIDIEGRLRSPQLVYFLRRVRAEFAADDLGHRTFMGEMKETRREPGF